MTAADADDLLARVADLTGFDATTIAVGTSVLVTGTPGVGVSSLVDACRSLAPDLHVVDAEDVAQQHISTAIGVAVLVVDPSSSVGEEERHILDDLRATHGTVGLVCAKIDAFWQWPRVLRAHRHTLDPHDAVALFAVSSIAALSGAVDESGVGALVEWLRSEVGVPDAVRTSRARIAAARGSVERLLYDLDNHDTLTGAAGADDTEALMRRRRVLVSGRDRGRTDRLAAVRAGLGRVRAESSVQMQTGLRTIATTAAGSDGDQTVDVSGLRALLDDLAATVSGAIEERIEEVRATALVGLSESEHAVPDPTGPDHAGTDRAGGPAKPDPPESDPIGAEPWALDVGPVRAPTGGRRGAEDALMLLIGASTGLGVGRLLAALMASVHAVGWIAMPLTLALGIGAAVWVIRMRHRTTARMQARGWVTETLGEVRARADHQIGVRVAGAESRIAGQIARSYDRRARLVTAEVAALDDRIRALRDDENARRRRRAAARTLQLALAEAQHAASTPAVPQTSQRAEQRKEELDGTHVR